MKKEIIKKSLVFGATALMLGLVFWPAVDAGDKQVFCIPVEDIIPQNTNGAITNITALEAYAMLTNTGDGIQIPIDVRYDFEWRPERIDTPIPENPRWYWLDLIQNVSILPKFLFQYDQCDIILYCKGGTRSYKAAKTIEAAGFTGTIYNMLGGITDWKAQGLPTAPGGIYNITVQEAWDLLTSTANGVQTPVDVRRPDEWASGYIDTPWPECPIWFTLDLLQDPENRTRFMQDHIGEETLLYCKGGYRSLLGNYELYLGNFNGTQYNMLGGITQWIAAGLPIRSNTAPAAPVITGPTYAYYGLDYNYNFTTTDAEGDVVYYKVDWGDGCPPVGWVGPIASGATLTLNHTYVNQGTYTITAWAKDFYDNESVPGQLTVTMPKNKEVNFNFKILNWLLERFPRAFPVIRQLIGA